MCGRSAVRSAAARTRCVRRPSGGARTCSCPRCRGGRWRTLIPRRYRDICGSVGCRGPCRRAASPVCVGAGRGDGGARARTGWSRAAARTTSSHGCWLPRAARAAAALGGRRAGGTSIRACPVSGVRAGQLAPPFARTDTASMLARDQSMTSAWASSSSTRCCSRSHTPAACQARSRRQAMCPEPTP